ncbi:unnamed protein product [Tetraodon nigroviridis]|uniref:(spotted green pufferfish) hypothetical protein n=1 Tax=Tetraodon nigroviridis TaxID=99883 RepID=Q4S0E1_TETNG|nr:unnamed protein product [Tetraodon nigroviridis]
METGAVKSVPVQVPHAVFGELPFRKDSVFVFGVQEPSGTQSVSPNLGYFIENGRTFDGNVILPHPYISITQCMLILSAEKSDCSQVLQSAVVAATSEQQLVYFENGMVAAQWSDVDSVHVGDFLACGTEQILVVFGDHAVAGKLEKFLLTDLCGITYAALESRLQEGLTALWDCDQESKENALIDKTAVAPAASSKPRVDRLWHRIIQDRMVVGATSGQCELIYRDRDEVQEDLLSLMTVLDHWVFLIDSPDYSLGDKEVRSLADSLSSLLCDEDREDDKKSPGHETPETGPVTELQGWRDLWQLDVEKSRKRLHPLVDVGRYRSLMQRVYDVQQNVDLVALLDSKRTFLS